MRHRIACAVKCVAGSERVGCPNYNDATLLPLSSENQSKGDLVHGRRHADRAGEQEQDHLQAARRQRARLAQDGAVAQRRAALRLRRDERHQRRLPGGGTEDGRRTSGGHLAQTLAEGPPRLQEDFAQHS